jgi:hypothetical protein
MLPDIEPLDMEPLVMAPFFLAFILSWSIEPVMESDMAPCDMDPDIDPLAFGLSDIVPLDIEPPDWDCASAEPAAPKLTNRAKAAIFPKIFITFLLVTAPARCRACLGFAQAAARVTDPAIYIPAYHS